MQCWRMAGSISQTKLACLFVFLPIVSAWSVLSDKRSTANISVGCVSALGSLELRSSPGNYRQAEMIPYSCAISCARNGDALAGVTNGSLCLCGDKVNRSLVGSCNQPCAGDARITCGDQDSFSVFNVSTLVRNEPKLDVNNTVFLETASYQVNLINDSATSFLLTHECTGYLDEKSISLAFGNRYNYTFTTWGEHVQLSLVVNEKIWQEYQKTVRVDVPLKVSVLHCPYHVTVGEEFECYGRLELGKGVNVSWLLNDSTSSMPLSDPVSWYVGHPVPRWIVSHTGVELEEGLVVSLSSAVTSPVLIHAWEMNVNQSGPVDLVILRPTCSGEKIYCPAEKRCCLLNSKFSSQYCNQKNSFCGSVGVGVNSTPLATCGFNNQAEEIILHNNYTIVYNITFNVQQGYNFKRLSSKGHFECLPGDVLGWIKKNVSATLAVDPTHGQLSVLKSVTTVTNGPISLTSQEQNANQLGSVLLGVIASKPIEYVLNLTASSKPGLHNVTFTHETLGGKKLTLTRAVMSLNPVGNLSLSSEIVNGSCVIYGPVNEPFNITLHVSSGTRLQVVWNVGNTSVKTKPYQMFGDIETFDLRQNFSFPSVNKYLLTVQVTNNVSGRIVYAEIVTQEKITGLRGVITSGNKTVLQGLKTELTASVSAGTNVSFRWYFGDGSETLLTKHDTVEHVYRKEGQVTTIVEAINGVSAANFSFLVNVSNPVEIILPPYGVNGSVVNITCRLPDIFTEEYIPVLHLENSSVISTNCNRIQYSFPTGLHNFSCFIQLQAAFVSSTSSLLVLEPVSGLQILSLPPVRLDDALLVRANITSGNNVTYLWQVLGQQSFSEVLAAERLINFTSSGENRVAVNASNAISMQYSEITVIVQVPLGALTVRASSNPGKSESLISFNITKTSGTYVNYTVNISEVNLYLGSSSLFNYNFTEGLHDIMVKARNDISESNVTYQMIVQDPLIEPLNISCPGVRRNDSVCVVQTDKTLRFKATIRYATNATFVWSWGSSGNQSDRKTSVLKVPVVSSLNHSFSQVKEYNVSVFVENKVSSIQNWLSVITLEKITEFKCIAAAHVAVNETFSLNTSLSKGTSVKFSFDTGYEKNFSQFQWKYPAAGIFAIKGTAENLISNATCHRTVIVQERIEWINFTTDIPVLATKKGAKIGWEIRGGTNVSTEVSWDNSTENVSYTSCTHLKSPSVLRCDRTFSFEDARSYLVRLRAHNLLDTGKEVSAIVMVEDPIEGLSIKPDKKAIFVRTKVNVTITITQGTHVKYQLNLGDNRTVNTTDRVVSVDYNNPGNYTLRVVAKNNIGKKSFTAVDVMVVTRPPKPEPITQLSLTAKHTILGSATKFQVSYKTGAFFNCTVCFGNGKRKGFAEGDVYKGFTYLYTKVRKYEVTLTCENNPPRSNRQTSKTTISVQEEIKGFFANTSLLQEFSKSFQIECSWTNGSNVSIVAFTKEKQPVRKSNRSMVDGVRRKGDIIDIPDDYITSPGKQDIFVKASNLVSSVQKKITIHFMENISTIEILVNPYVPTGYRLSAYLSYENGSDVRVTWSFGDGSGRNMTECNWKRTCSKDHVYNKTGIYKITAEAQNNLSRDVDEIDVTIQNPIYGWEFFTANKSVEKSPSYVLLRPNTSYRTNATYQITFDKTNTSTKGTETDLSETAGEIVETHTFDRAGCYEAKVTLKNRVSEVVLTTVIEVRGVIEKPRLTPQSLRPGNLSEGILPIEYPVKFSTGISPNSCLNYSWIVKANETIIKTSATFVFSYTFPRVGRYKVIFMAYNDEKNVTDEMDVPVDLSVTGLFFASDGVAKVNDTVNFVVLCASKGRTTYFEVDFGDKKSVEVLNVTKITKDFTTEYKLNVPFNPIGFFGAIFNHTYSVNGTYKAGVKTRNASNSPEYDINVEIAKAPCPLPRVEIIGGSLEYKTAPQVPYEVQYTFFSDVITDCKDEIRVAFQWTVFKADIHLLKRKGSSLPPADDLKYPLPDKIRTKKSSLTIPKKTLQPGLYVFEVTCSFPTMKANTKHIAYLKIQSPPLIANIKGGTARSVPWNKELVLDASDSVDPLTESNDTFSYKWSCRRKKVAGRGGCFGAGNKLSSKDDEKIVKFRSRILFEKFTYQFTVTVFTEEEGRNHSYTQEIRAIPGKPPILNLRCVSNCAVLVNPESRLSLKTECLENCNIKSYKWTLPNSTCFATTKNIWPDRTLTPQSSSDLTVKAQTFKEKCEYTLQLDVENDDGKTGFVSYKVVTNSPPHNGSCVFVPLKGFSMKTGFNFSCQGWIDDQENAYQPLFYKVFASPPSVRDNPQLLYHGPKNSLDNIRLPAAPGPNHIFNIYIHVEDVFKAYNETIFNVTVNPRASVDLTQLKNSTSEIEVLFGSGDIQAANRIAVATMSEIKSSNVTNDPEETAEIFRDIVKDVSKELPDDLNSMRQCVQTIVFAVESDEAVPPDTQVAALDAFKKTSGKLRSEAREDIGNDVVEDVAHGLLTGVGDIMRASAWTQAKFSNQENSNETLSEENQDVLNKSRKNVRKASDAIDEVTASILEKKVRDEKRFFIETKNLQVFIDRATSGKLNGSAVEFSGNSSAEIKFPADFEAKSGVSHNDLLDVVALYFSTSLHQSYNTSKLVKSSSVSLGLKTRNENIKVQNLKSPLKIKVPRQASDKTEIPENRTENKTETKLSGPTVHILELRSAGNAFVVEVIPEYQNTNITLYFRKEGAPTLETFDFNKTFPVPPGTPRTNTTSEARSYFLSNDVINGTKYFVGVASHVDEVIAKTNYTFKSHEIGCYFWKEDEKLWSTDGCTPGENSSKTVVECLCNHATLFGSNFFVAPNSLDIGNEIHNFKNLGDYPALIATICVILGIYIIGMIWALKKDRQAAGKVSLHVAADNEPSDSQRYEVTLFTGRRRNAGSTAEVSLIISGENGDSEPRLLQRISPLSYSRSSQDSYLVTTGHSLGALLYIRVWHDNSGSDPAWFLSEVTIRDVETGEQFFFLCNSWLACDEGDGLVDRLVPVASPEELKDFQYLFMQNSSQGFSDGHLWFSIILRPAQSRFTHAQRVSCCLCLLLCTMLANAMFYQVDVAKENNVDVDVGPYQFTWHEIMVGIQSSLIVLPINLFLVGIFRRIAARPRKSSKNSKTNDGSSKYSGRVSKAGISVRDIELDRSRRTVLGTNHTDRSQPPEVQTKAGNRMWLFPWWFVFIGWFVLIITSFTAGFFTLLYGITFGKRKQEQWLTALVISVFEDILVSQPIKIFAFSLFVAFIIRRPSTGDINEENEELIKDEQWVLENLVKANPDGFARKKVERKPPDKLILKKMRLFRLKERKMFQVFREVLQYFFFWWIVLMIAYGHREPDAHWLTTSMEKIFVELGHENDHFGFKRTAKQDIYKTRNKRELLMWVNDVIIPGLSHEVWYNNSTDRHKSVISDGVGYLVGSARLRQLRIKNDTCEIAKEFENQIDGCESEYSFSDEYRKKTNWTNWFPSNGSLPDMDHYEMWQYMSQKELYERPFWADLAVYRGGGYVLKLDKTKSAAQQQIKHLNKTHWIDGKTRAVFIEFTVFSPNKNLHCVVTILFECPASGGCKATYQILATRLDELIGNYRLFVLACELIFVVMMAGFTYKAFKQMLKEGKGYWRMFWNWMEMTIIVLAWSCLAFYILRFIANKWTKAKFHDDQEQFVAFRYVATADQLYGIILSFVVFLTSVKFLRLFRFNRRMSLLGSTLKYAALDLLNFFFLFAIAFVACACIAYLLFHNDIDMFSSMLVTTQTLLNIILGKFKYMDLSQDVFVASVVVLFIYVVIVVFLLMNVFLVILNDAFKVVKNDNDLQENEHEIVDYITGRFKSWLGFRTKPSKLKSDFEHEYGFRPAYVSDDNGHEVPSAVILDRKVQELLDFVDNQVYLVKLEDSRVDEFEDEDTKKKCLLLLMS